MQPARPSSAHFRKESERGIDLDYQTAPANSTPARLAAIRQTCLARTHPRKEREFILAGRNGRIQFKNDPIIVGTPVAGQLDLELLAVPVRWPALHASKATQSLAPVVAGKAKLLAVRGLERRPAFLNLPPQ